MDFPEFAELEESSVLSDEPVMLSDELDELCDEEVTEYDVDEPYEITPSDEPSDTPPASTTLTVSFFSFAEQPQSPRAAAAISEIILFFIVFSPNCI